MGAGSIPATNRVTHFRRLQAYISGINQTFTVKVLTPARWRGGTRGQTASRRVVDRGPAGAGVCKVEQVQQAAEEAEAVGVSGSRTPLQNQTFEFFQQV